MEKERTHPYVQLARLTVERLLRRGPLPTSRAERDGDERLWNRASACFVSIKTLDGGLRGCVGTIQPACPSLDLEIIVNAQAAAVRDPRFPPMTASELGNVVFFVDVLSPPEPATRDELDPAVWGVIVTQGWRRGVLLPDLEGVDTVEEQLSIAARKAGIHDLQDIKIERFRVDRQGR